MNTNTTMKKAMILAVDFDGVLCEDRYPKIGEANEEMLTYFINRKAAGDKIILWTCRKGIYLKNAVSWCKKRGLDFDAVNENLPEVIKAFHGDTRKIFADLYFDDRNGEYLFQEEVAPPDEEEPIVVAKEHPDWKYAISSGDISTGCDDDFVVYSAAHDEDIQLCLKNDGTYRIIDHRRVNYSDIVVSDNLVSTDKYDASKYICAGYAAIDYIHSVYPIKLPYVPEYITGEKYSLLGSCSYMDIDLFYVAGVTTPEKVFIEVDQWFIYDFQNHKLTPISNRKRKRICKRKEKGYE